MSGADGVSVGSKADAFIELGRAEHKLLGALAENADAIVRALNARCPEEVRDVFADWLVARTAAGLSGKVQRAGATRKSEDGELPVRMGRRK